MVKATAAKLYFSTDPNELNNTNYFNNIKYALVLHYGNKKSDS
jgi:hypothetical protein